MFEMRRCYSFDDTTKRSIFFTIFVLSALLSSSAVFAVEPSDNADTKQEKLFTLHLGPLGKHGVSEELKIPILIASGILALLYYGPTMFGRLRETIRESKSNVKSLEVERMRLENLKIKYEIEAIKKTHDLSMLDLAIDPKEVENIAISPAVTKVDTSPKFNTLIRPQLEQLDVRQRFMFRRIVAFFIDYFFLAFMGGLIISLFEAILGLDFLYDEDPTISIVLFLSVTLYFAGMWATLGATVGLKILGLRIISLDGRAITAKAALIRFTVWIVSSVFGFFWLLFDTRKQSLADKAAKTVVVKVRGHLEQTDSEFIPEG